MLTPDDLLYNKNNKIVKERLEILIDEAIKNATGKIIDLRFEISYFNMRINCKFSKEVFSELIKKYEQIGWICSYRFDFDRNIDSVHITMRSK